MTDSTEQSIPNRAIRRGWKTKRRQWLDLIAHDTRLTDGCKAFLLLLARRSNDEGKPVWGFQERLAETLARARRSVGRYTAEAEGLGLLIVVRAPRLQRLDGTWHRAQTNKYYLRIPTPLERDLKALRRRNRKAASMREHPARTDVTAVSHKTPFGEASEPLPRETAVLDGHTDPETGEIFDFRAQLAERRAWLRGKGKSAG